MDCLYYREQVSAFVDSELDQHSQTQLFDHLADCSECQLFLDGLMKFKSLKHQEEVDFPNEIDAFLFDEMNRRRYVYTLSKRGLEVKAPFWERRVALSVPALTAMIAAILIGMSTLFVNLLAQGKSSTPPPLPSVQEEKKIERLETVVYGVPGVTVYGLPEKEGKKGL